MSDARAAVRSAVRDDRDWLLDVLADLVGTPSVSGHEADAQAVVIERLAAMGLDPDVWTADVETLRDHPAYFDTVTYDEFGYDDRPNVAARWPGTDGEGRSLVLGGHVDVVSVDEDEWSYDPWSATVEDGRLYGRGALDMKGGLAANLLALRALRRADVELAGDLIVESTVDEEAGGTGGALSALERGYVPDAAIVTEPYGVPNVGIASAGALYFRIEVPGRSAHAAHGFRGVNAVTEASRIVAALDELDRERKARIAYEPATRRYPDAEGAVTNLNVGVFEAGDWPSTVPSEAHLECRIGWPPGERRDAVRAEVREAVDGAVADSAWLSEHPPEFEWIGWDAEPHELDTDCEFLDLTVRNVETVTGGETAFVGGLAGLDERFYANYYDVPAPSVGPRGERAHGADEYVEVESLVEVAEAVALTALDWCGRAD